MIFTDRTTDHSVELPSSAEGISLETPAGIFHESITGGLSYSPLIIDEQQATSLSSVLGIKNNGNGPQWSHYIDHQRLYPNIRLPGTPEAADGADAESQTNSADHPGLYLTFQVSEYPTCQTLRTLAVEVASTWVEDVEAREAAEAAAAEKARQEEEARQAEEEARRAKEAERKRAADAKAAAAKAPDGSVADQGMQELIKEKMKALNIPPCPQGYGYKRVEAQRIYICDGGGHQISFEQLGIA